MIVYHIHSLFYVISFKTYQFIDESTSIFNEQTNKPNVQMYIIRIFYLKLALQYRLHLQHLTALR